MANAYRTSVIELFTPATAITAQAKDTVKQGQFVALTEGIDDEHPHITVATPGGRAFGLAATDAEAGALVTVQRGSGRCFRIEAESGVTAGADLEVGADGKPITATTGAVVAQALYSIPGGYADITLI